MVSAVIPPVNIGEEPGIDHCVVQACIEHDLVCLGAALDRYLGQFLVPRIDRLTMDLVKTFIRYLSLEVFPCAFHIDE